MRTIISISAAALLVACGEDATSRYVPSSDQPLSATGPERPVDDSNAVGNPNQGNGNGGGGTIEVNCAALLADAMAKNNAIGGFILRQGETRDLGLELPKIEGCPLEVTVAARNPANPHPLGSLDDQGRFSAPEAVTADTAVAVHIAVKDKPAVNSEITVRLLPNGIYFIPDDGRIQGATANVYYLPENTSALPDFAELEPIQKLVAPNIDVPLRDYVEGLPGIEGGRNEWFGIRYDFALKIDKAGEYRFAVTSDDGTKLYLDENLIVSNDGLHGTRQKSTETPLALEAGRHHLRLDYFQGPRMSIQVQLYWMQPGSTTWEIVPGWAFYRQE